MRITGLKCNKRITKQAQFEELEMMLNDGIK